jgi:hypothetical protein
MHEVSSATRPAKDLPGAAISNVTTHAAGISMGSWCHAGIAGPSLLAATSGFMEAPAPGRVLPAAQQPAAQTLNRHDGFRSNGHHGFQSMSSAALREEQHRSAFSAVLCLRQGST